MSEWPPVDGEEIERTVLAGLKDFQRRTVDYVYRRMYTDSDATRRFLVADEVGLGKTLVARGLIAKAIRELQKDPNRRIDIIYVCSNADIAAQNVRRLNVTGRDDFTLASRITLLPLHLRHLSSHGVNFVSFTPGTSFDFGQRTGQAGERALLYRLLEAHWGKKAVNRVGVHRVLQGGVSTVERFKEIVSWTPSRIGVGEAMIDPTLFESFAEHVDGRIGLRERFFELADAHRPAAVSGLWWQRREMVSELRRLLARSCVAALEPDLIILDEFQRFRHLLESPDPEDLEDVRALAHHLFDQPDARVLMLSATPYKMYSLADESDDDHYRDFVQTASFLLGTDSASDLAGDLRTFRRELIGQGRNPDELLKVRRRIERRLRRVMARTERLSVTPDRAGMLTRAPVEHLTLTGDDVRDYVAARQLSHRLGGGDPLEYWKSSPYLLNYMEGYKLKSLVEASVESGTDFPKLIEEVAGLRLLPRKQVENYGRVDPGNARLRALFADTVDRGMWQLLWMPPSLPYYQADSEANAPVGGFTKRLIFSGWNLAPQAISTLLSYEAERRMMTLRGRRRNTQQARKAIRGLLRIARDSRDRSRLVGMPVFALVYPSPVLARLGDPQGIWASVTSDEASPHLDQVREIVRDRIETKLRPLLRRASPEGPVDESWYWAAPLLLDRASDEALVDQWLSGQHAGHRWHGDTHEEGDAAEATTWSDHVSLAHGVSRIDLGRPPDDLIDVLVSLAVAGPAIVALRAISRIFGGSPALVDERFRDSAARIAWGFRTLFNIPEVMGVVRSADSDESAYWRQVLAYSMAGNLQAVMDEYIHILPESLGIVGRPTPDALETLTREIHNVLSLRPASYRVDDLSITDDVIAINRMPMRARFALRFGVRMTDELTGVNRSGEVRAAFNSPFWPFVLASTSLGQEGLDFHQYCHAVVHWNLPANPVDLEQREGRIHRYKGHAVRKNVASAHAMAGKRARGRDPWTLMFEAARPARIRGKDRDLVPYWVYDVPGGAKIQRYVPALPLSREVAKYARLQTELAAYRMVFGQPRQEDLVAFLGDEMNSDELADRLDELRIDLTPR